jgi:hypothetical protein
MCKPTDLLCYRYMIPVDITHWRIYIRMAVNHIQFKVDIYTSNYIRNHYLEYILYIQQSYVIDVRSFFSLLNTYEILIILLIFFIIGIADGRQTFQLEMLIITQSWESMAHVVSLPCPVVRPLVYFKVRISELNEKIILVLSIASLLDLVSFCPS